MLDEETVAVHRRLLKIGYSVGQAASVKSGRVRPETAAAIPSVGPRMTAVTEMVLRLRRGLSSGVLVAGRTTDITISRL